MWYHHELTGMAEMKKAKSTCMLRRIWKNRVPLQCLRECKLAEALWRAILHCPKLNIWKPCDIAVSEVRVTESLPGSGAPVLEGPTLGRWWPSGSPCGSDFMDMFTLWWLVELSVLFSVCCALRKVKHICWEVAILSLNSILLAFKDKDFLR